MVYIFTFLSSLLLLNFALKFKNTNKRVYLILSALGIFIPCFVAGVRDYSIGTDVNLYVNPLYRASLHFNNFFDYIKSTGSEVNDLGYLFLTFISGKISKDIFTLFFLSEFLIIYPVYKALKNINNNDNNKIVIFGMFILYMVLFNLSLNMVRQSIAISLSILSFSYFIKEDKFKTILFLILAYSFHSSSLVMIATFVFYNFFKNEKTEVKSNLLFEYLVVSIIITIIFLLPNIIIFLIDINLLDSTHFRRMLDNPNNYDINFIRTTWYIIFYLIFALNRKKSRENIPNSQFYIFMSFISIIILQLGAVIQFTERIGYYLLYTTLIVGIPFLTINKKTSIIKRNNTTLIIIIVFVSYWFYWFVLKGSSQTYPFVFRG